MVYSNRAATSPGKPSVFPANLGERYVRSGLSPLEYSLGLRWSVRRFFSAPEPRRVIIGAGVTDLLNKLLPGAFRRNAYTYGSNHVLLALLSKDNDHVPLSF